STGRRSDTGAPWNTGILEGLGGRPGRGGREAPDRTGRRGEAFMGADGTGVPRPAGASADTAVPQGGAPSAEEILRGLDPEQLEAARSVRGPVCILAGAGTGKTRAITHR